MSEVTPFGRPLTYEPQHRTPPHSAEAEQGVLSSMMLDARNVIAECLTKITDEYFYVPSHRTIYQSLVNRWSAGEAVDLITFTQCLRDLNLLDAVGGAHFVTSLFTFVPTAANVGYYLEIMRDKYILRQIIATGTESVRQAYEEQDEVNILLSSTQSSFLAIGDRNAHERLSIAELSTQAMDNLTEAVEKKGKIPGLATGLIDLDRMLGGMRPKQLIIIAGETGEGKTSLCLNIVESIASEGHACGIISLEMGGAELCESFISSIGKIDLHTMVTSGGSATDYGKITDAVTRLKVLPIFIHDESDIDPMKLRGIGRQLKHEHKIKLLMVDYIQLLTPGDTKDENRERAMSGAAQALKQMAKELDIVVIGISQLNEAGKLRESRAIGHHADKVMTITHDEEEIGPSFVHVNKNRKGPTGDVAVTFLRQFVKFVNATQVFQPISN